jgi:hypothetical protein
MKHAKNVATKDAMLVLTAHGQKGYWIYCNRYTPPSSNEAIVVCALLVLTTTIHF